MHDRQETKETEGEQAAGQRPCQMGERRSAPGPASELSRDKPMPLSEGEKRILQCLGAAVLLQWNDLPTPMQQQLFEHAVAMGEAGQTAQLKEQIARFLHTHKDDARASR